MAKKEDVLSEDEIAGLRLSITEWSDMFDINKKTLQNAVTRAGVEGEYDDKEWRKFLTYSEFKTSAMFTVKGRKMIANKEIP